MNDTYAFTHQLQSQFRRRIDQHVAFGQTDDRRGAGAFVFGIVASANCARTADYRHSNRCASPQDDEAPTNVGSSKDVRHGLTRLGQTNWRAAEDHRDRGGNDCPARLTKWQLAGIARIE